MEADLAAVVDYLAQIPSQRQQERATPASQHGLNRGSGFLSALFYSRRRGSGNNAHPAQSAADMSAAHAADEAKDESASAPKSASKTMSEPESAAALAAPDVL